MADHDLAAAFAQWTDWNWRLRSFNSWMLLLIADNSLSYHHSLEVAFGGVSYVRCPQEFGHPSWRPADEDDQLLAARLEGETVRRRPKSSIPFAWQAEVTSGDLVSCLVVAESVSVAEGLWLHYRPAEKDLDI